MSFLDKLKFWKHEDEPVATFGELESAFPTGGGPLTPTEGVFPTGLPETKTPDDFGSLTPMSTSAREPAAITIQGATVSSGQSPYQIVQPQPLYQPVQPPLNKDLEILSLKLDAIKNSLDTINMRLERLEHIERGEVYPMKQGRY